jgi:hypothetical protein
MSTVATFMLDDPAFVQSYFWIFDIDYTYMTEGIILCSIVFFFFIVTLVIANRKAYH